MFEGYFGLRRRRIKTLLISIILSLVCVGLIYRQRIASSITRLNLLKQVSFETKLTSDSSLKIEFPFLPAAKKTPANVLSSIEFINSPYFESESHSSKIIPIIVLSKASNIEIRDAIRRTWAFEQFYRNDTIEIKVFFLVGTDDYTIKRIRAEQMIFNDVIHVSLPDINSFATYKEFSAMIWIRSYLPKAAFYIKTEDDVIMNVGAIIMILLPMIENVRNENLIIGWFGPEHTVQRGTYQKFVNAVMPPSQVDLYYAMSLLYIITSEASDRILDALSHVEFVEQPGDPFVTGILRDAAHVQMKNLASNNRNYQYELSNGACADEFKKNRNLLLCTSSLHIGSRYSIPEYFDAWNVLLSQK